MSAIPKIPRASGSTLNQLGTLSGPQTYRLLTPLPLITNPVNVCNSSNPQSLWGASSPWAPYQGSALDPDPLPTHAPPNKSWIRP